MGQAASPPSHLSAPGELAGELGRRVPSWFAAADAAAKQARIGLGLVIESVRSQESSSTVALRGLYSQAVNDFLDLLFDVAAGRGRPALRQARSLFELEITAVDLDCDPALAQRWLDHLPYASLAEAALQLPLSRLTGRSAKAHRHRIRRLRREAAPAAARAESTWGSSIKRQWNTLSLRERAADQGREDGYSFYRYASAPVHASSGGLMGLEADVDGSLIIRSGPALQACPTALLYATDSFRRTTSVVEKLLPMGLIRLHRALNHLDDGWSEYREAVLALDRNLWPASPPMNASALVVISRPGGEMRWWEYLPEMRIVRRAASSSVVTHGEQAELLSTLVERVLPPFAHGRVGIELEAATIDDPGEGDWIAVERIIDSAPFTISQDGVIGVPEDFDAPNVVGLRILDEFHR